MSPGIGYLNFIFVMSLRESAYSWKKIMSAKEIIAELLKNDWQLARVRGSHYIFVKNTESVIVPYHKTVKKGVLKNIKKQVELAENKVK